MIFVITALRCEAAPFIKGLSLKKNTGATHFDIYDSDNIRLIISGTGGPAALCAVTYLLAVSNVSKEDILINCGCCGSMAGDPKSTGKMFVMRSLKDEAFGRSYYPDMIRKLPFPEADLITVPEVYRGTPVHSNIPVLVDMEGAYVFQAASKFIYAHNIFILKAVSDSGHDSSGVTPEYIGDLINSHLETIKGSLISPVSQKKRRKTDLSRLDLKLSQYQRHELRKLAENYAVRHDDLDDVISRFSRYKAADRKESSAVYALLRERLLEP